MFDYIDAASAVRCTLFFSKHGYRPLFKMSRFQDEWLKSRLFTPMNEEDEYN